MKYSYLLIWMALLGTGCGKDPDQPGISGSSSPQITVTGQSVPVVSEKLCGASFDNVLKINTGETLQLKLRFRSGRELAQYKIDIHANFDCHAHGRVVAVNPWQVLNTSPLSGTDTTVTEAFPVPRDAAAGNYHLMIRMLDESGAEAPFVEFNMVLVNPEDTRGPVISLTQPAADSIAQQAGTELILAGTVTDDISLQQGRLELSWTDAAGTEFKVRQLYFTDTPHISYPFNIRYTVPFYAVRGKAVFHLKAYDAVHNTGTTSVKVWIH